MIKKSLSLMVFVSTFTLFAVGDVYSYELLTYPKSNSNCHEQAKEVARHFSEVTHKTVLKSLCVKDDEMGYDFSLEYESTQALNFVTTRYKPMTAYQEGRYADKKTCDEHLTEQTELFETATGLTHLFSYCAHLRYDSGASWIPAIDAVGTAVKTPYLGGYSFFSSLKNMDVSEYLSGLRTTLARYNGVLAGVFIHPSLGMATASIHYYAPTRLKFDLNEVSKTRELEQCQAQIAEIKNFLKNTSNPPFVTYCGAVSIMGQWELNLGYVEAPTITWRHSVENYASFEECESKRPDLVDYYKTNVEPKTLGGLCTEDQQRYRVQLFKERS